MPLAKRLGQRNGTFVAQAEQSVIAFSRSGDLAAYAAASSASLEFLRETEQPWDFLSLTALGLAQYYQGDWAESLDTLAQAAPGGAGTTLENVALGVYALVLRELTVLKKGGQREPFDREKVLRSMRIALRKRPVGRDTGALEISSPSARSAVLSLASFSSCSSPD